jgi:erythronate-4-phosphate dehydrogenase
MKVLLNDPPREEIEGGNEFVSIEKIKDQCDIISFHVPLNVEGRFKTFHLADEKFFNELKQKPIVINSSRGEVISTSSQRKAIRENIVTSASLDVWENEPNIDLNLLDLTEFGTSHIAGYSIEGKANGTSVCVNKISDYFKFNIPSNWYPKDLPDVKSGNEIFIECEGLSSQEIISEAVFKSYDIERDNLNLKNNPEAFEFLRGAYPVRREFSYYQLRLNNFNEAITNKLKDLGFQIKN